jgi:hypothetical protein
VGKILNLIQQSHWGTLIEISLLIGIDFVSTADLISSLGAMICGEEKQKL